MVERVTREKNNNLMKFQVSESLCLAINNIDYVLQYIQPFVQVIQTLIGVEMGTNINVALHNKS